MGLPVGKFFKVNVTGGTRYIEYFENSDGRKALNDFNDIAGNPQRLRLVLPPDHFEYRTTVAAEMNRRGWSFSVFGTAARRSRFDRFGIVDDSAGGAFVAYDPLADAYVPAPAPAVETRFARFGATGAKEWFLPNFQKLRLEANWFEGSDLDRFSRWQFSLFGDTRLNGFAGSGVRFDDGQILRVGYSFNLFEAVRFDAGIDSARVRDRSSPDGRQNHGGFGIGANFVAPWKLVVSLSYGRALWSDVPELEGEEEFLLLVLRLF